MRALLGRRLRTADAAWTDGGDAHGEEDYRRWLADAGYGAVRLHDLDDPPQTVVLAER